MRAHGVAPWQAETDGSQTGFGIKVGIIDWGFAGLNDTPGLTDLNIWDEDGTEAENANSNAFCQSVRHSTWPGGQWMYFFSLKCEPTKSRIVPPVDHGVNIAELVKDIAPSAELFYAQANSPRQVYKAARWLKDTKNVDVIVHAAGWAYDGKGDGTSPIGGASNWTFNENPSTWGTNQHSAYRYEPSPLNTVDKITEDGPVWINAAGNMELITMRKTGLGVVGGTTAYKDFLVLNSGITATDATTAGQRACQRVPWNFKKIYIHNLRWADSWTSPTVDLDFFVGAEHIRPDVADSLAFVNTADGRDEQLDRDLPMRRAVHFAANTHNEVCLRIKVNRDDAGNLPTLPSWIQFHIITQDFETAPMWNTGNDVTGHSIVNPAESANPNLLAVGARNMRPKRNGVLNTSLIELMDYSSLGPVYRKGASLTTTPNRKKPDVTAASGAATWTKYNSNCGATGTAAACGEDLFFGGTSAATGQTGGMAALVVQLFKETGTDYTAADVAKYLKDSGRQLKTNLADPNNQWGHGFIELPCRAKGVSLPYTNTSRIWSTDDCKSTRRGSTSSPRYAEYYTFYVDERKEITIDIESAVDSYLYLIEGAYSGGHQYLEGDDNGGTETANINASIKRTLDPGFYTVEATARNTRATGNYTIKISNHTTPTVTLTPVPSTLVANGKWVEYALTTTGPIKAVANPTGTTKRIEIHDSTTSANFCPPEREDPKSYSANGTLHLAGCVAGTGKVEIRDAANNNVIETYSITVTNPNPTWDITLDPVPSTIPSDGSWNRFQITSGGPVKVVVNPSGTPRLEIGTSNTFANQCPNRRNDDHAPRNDGQYIYISGCVAGTGTIQLRRTEDDSLARTYTVTVLSPTWDATLDPDPTTETFTDDGSEWLAFEVESGGQIKIVVNPTEPETLEITNSSTAGDHCSGEVGDSRTRSDGETVYLAGCETGTGTIELRRVADDSLARTYTITVVSAASLVCNPLQSFDTDRRSASSVYISWSSPVSGGAASTGRKIEVKKWVSGQWAYERVITEPATSLSAWHLGLDGNSWYSYRAKNVCGSMESAYTSWSTEASWSGSSGSSGAPAPTPKPSGPSGAVGPSNDEDPPPPSN